MDPVGEEFNNSALLELLSESPAVCLHQGALFPDPMAGPFPVEIQPRLEEGRSRAWCQQGLGVGGSR